MILLFFIPIGALTLPFTFFIPINWPEQRPFIFLMDGIFLFGWLRIMVRAYHNAIDEIPKATQK